MHISDFIYNINNFIVITYVYVTKSNWIITYEKKEVAIIRMYKPPPISNLAISDQLNGLNWNWFKVDKGGAHSLCKII